MQLPQLGFPKHLTPDTHTRAGRMLESGDIRATVTDIETGEHITIRFKAILDNRDRKVAQDRNWVRVSIGEATHVFEEVPSASGDFPDKVGTFYPRTGRFFPAPGADLQRVSAAAIIAQWLNGDIVSSKTNPIRIHEESNCGVCGKTLTDPQSIELGIGPECNRKATSSQHQVKMRAPNPIRLAEEAAVRSILEDIASLSDDAQAKIRRELDMWHSQARRTTR